MTKPTLASAYTAPRPMPDAMNGSKLITNANFWSSAGHPAGPQTYPLTRSYRRDCAVSAHSAYAIRTLPTLGAVRLLVTQWAQHPRRPFASEQQIKQGRNRESECDAAPNQSARLTKSRDLITLPAKQK